MKMAIAGAALVLAGLLGGCAAVSVVGATASVVSTGVGAAASVGSTAISTAGGVVTTTAGGVASAAKTVATPAAPAY